MKINGTDTYNLLLPTITAQFGEAPQDLVEISAGGNNRLFRFRVAGSNRLAKFYPHDGRQRLEREFMALKFFSSRGLRVPQAFFANAEHRFAVYSLEPGQTKPASELTQAEVEQLADFILALHDIPTAEVPPEFLPSDGIVRSYQDYINLMSHRMQIFEKALSENRMHPKARQFADEMNIIALIQDLTRKAVAGLSSAAISQPLPAHLMRLTPIDMGPHNALFTDSGICFIDFEFTGWDEPMRTIVEFTNHQANRGLHPNLRQHFRNYYLSKTNLPEEVTSRWPIDDRLMAIIWLTTQLSRMTPERIAGLQFANPAFEVETHINRSIAKAQERILELENPTLHKQTIDLLA